MHDHAADPAAATDTTAHADPAVRAFLHRSLGDVAGRRVLDLGCGTGWLSLEIAGAGGTAVGIDADRQLIEQARAAATDATGAGAAEFVLADLSTGLPDLGGRHFDRIVAQMLLADMAELDSMIADVGRAMVSSGRFVVTIPHPALQWAAEGYGAGTSLAGYLEPAEKMMGAPGGPPHYHRPLQWYVDRLADAGMAVVRLAEIDVHHGPGCAPVLGLVAVPVTPGLALPVGRPTTLLDGR